MLQQASKPTDELLREASTSAGMRYLIAGEKGAIALFLQPDRILVYRGEESTPFGVLRFGGPHSGAIWVNGNLIGEYDKNLDGEFFIVEVEDGFISPESRRQKDPVAFLLERVGT